MPPNEGKILLALLKKSPNLVTKHEAVPAVLRPYICELGQHLRTQQEYINEQKITVTDYQHYIENWVHEIKKPLSLMTLLLDNRKDEMSPLVHTRMLYVRDHTRQDIEQILYFTEIPQAMSIMAFCIGYFNTVHC